MQTIWYTLLVALVAGYVVLDGFDFGAGALHLLVARSDRERRQVLAAIGPFWDGNEVWLLAAGGVLFLAFPPVLAAGLSGLYLAVHMLLWVLVLRGIAIEFRSHGKDRLWRAFWDGTFTLASALAPLLLGVALGNLLRGMPLDSQGWFALPLFDSLWPHEPLGILDAYTLLTGTFALLAIAHHGALFLAWKTDGGVRERARAWAGRGFPVLVVLWLTTTAATLWVRPDLRAVLAQRPLAWAATAVFIAGLATSRLARRRERDLLAFLGSCAFLLGLLAATAAVVHPTMIRAFPVAERSLTALNAASSAESLTKGLLWWPAGFALAVLYLGLLFHIHRGKARAAEDGEGY